MCCGITFAVIGSKQIALIVDAHWVRYVRDMHMHAQLRIPIALVFTVNELMVGK